MNRKLAYLLLGIALVLSAQFSQVSASVNVYFEQNDSFEWDNTYSDYGDDWDNVPQNSTSTVYMDIIKMTDTVNGTEFEWFLEDETIWNGDIEHSGIMNDTTSTHYQWLFSVNNTKASSMPESMFYDLFWMQIYSPHASSYLNEALEFSQNEGNSISLEDKNIAYITRKDRIMSYKMEYFLKVNLTGDYPAALETPWMDVSILMLNYLVYGKRSNMLLQQTATTEINVTQYNPDTKTNGETKIRETYSWGMNNDDLLNDYPWADSLEFIEDLGIDLSSIPGYSLTEIASSILLGVFTIVYFTKTKKNC